MTKFIESNIEFDFGSLNVIRADIRKPRGMPSVDFIVYLPELTYFIEVKNYFNQEQEEKADNFNDLVKWYTRKYYATFAHEYAHLRDEKPISYKILLEHPTIKEERLETLTASLRDAIPQQKYFARQFIRAVNVYDLAKWNTKNKLIKATLL